MKPNINSYHKTIGKELQTVKDRVRQLIGNRNWSSDGRYKEEILKEVIKRYLPELFAIGTGFVIGIFPSVTTQIDIIIYDKSVPVLFRHGDFVIINADGVRGIVEVKTSVTQSKLKETVIKASRNGETILSSHKDRSFNFFNGLFPNFRRGVKIYT